MTPCTRCGMPVNPAIVSGRHATPDDCIDLLKARLAVCMAELARISREAH